MSEEEYRKACEELCNHIRPLLKGIPSDIVVGVILLLIDELPAENKDYIVALIYSYRLNHPDFYKSNNEEKL